MRVSLSVPLSCIAELCEITRSARIFDRSVVKSSVRPSLKYSFSGSGLRLANGTTTIDLVSGSVSVASAVRASTNAFADSNRSIGTLLSALAMALATGDDTPGRTVASGGAGSVTCFARTARGDEATNGGSPASISYSTQASE